MLRFKLLTVTTAVFLTASGAAFASSVAAPAAAAPAAAAPAAAPVPFRQFPNIVDFAYVRPHATLPRDINVGPVLIDSRPTARRFDPGHIPTSISIPDTRFDQLVHLLPADRNRALIFSCGGLHCDLSHNSAFKAQALGYTNIKVYAAGDPDWVAKGGLLSVSVDYVTRIVNERQNVALIDSRPARVFERGSIPGAISIPDTQFEQFRGRLPADLSHPLIFFCGGFICDLSDKSAMKARALGYTNVRTFAAGMPGWTAKHGAPAAAAPAAAAPAAAAPAAAAPAAAAPAAAAPAAAAPAAAAPAAAAPAAAAPAAAAGIQPGRVPGTISVASFTNILATNPGQLLLVDVRSAADFQRATLPGAIHVPVAEVQARLATLPQGKPIVFFCATGGRAGEAYDTAMLATNNQFRGFFLDAVVRYAEGGAYTITAN